MILAIRSHAGKRGSVLFGAGRFAGGINKM